MKFRKVLVLKARLDMAPLIDVVFLLLIFFLLTSSFVLQPGIKVKLPKAKTTEISKEEEVYITIDKDNFLYLNEKLIPEEELNKRLLRLASEDPNKLVIVKADQDVRHGRVVGVLDQIKRSGLSKLAIATQPEEVKSQD
ncbi:biopolymer transporter ExbD [bacterium]|nr:biopolymer transporter ExbD [bacterium]MBU1781750.1 biopolymer transporter ExbD [bacterium]MBU2600427.1 biopolymer transporter ExbD [bacterium]